MEPQIWAFLVVSREILGTTGQDPLVFPTPTGYMLHVDIVWFSLLIEGIFYRFL